MLDLIRFDLLNWFYEIWDLFDLEIIAFMRFLDFLMLEHYIGTQGFINFIKSHFYAITRSWHAHQKIRLDELIWTKGV